MSFYLRDRCYSNSSMWGGGGGGREERREESCPVLTTLDSVPYLTCTLRNLHKLRIN